FLGLVEPDGMTIAHSYAPAFPPQVTDISYGVAADLGTVGFFNIPTPGAASPASPSEAGPLISLVTDSPQLVPGDGDDLVVSAQVDALLTPIASVTLHYRTMFGGEVALPMSDSGGGLFSATIPHTASAAGEMLRWYVTAEDTAGESRREPPFLAATNSPEYFGTVIADPSAASALPTMFWFTASPGAAGTRRGTRSSVYFEGEFYDNVFTRVRGASSEGVAKKSHKFDFNTGHHFRFSPDAPRVDEININSTFQDKAYIRPQLAFESYTAAGVVASDASTWRVQQNGAFFSVASFVDQVDADLLDRKGLDPEGALYKMFNGVSSATSGVEKKTRRYENNADLQALVRGVQPRNRNRAEFLFDHINIPAMINYATAGIISQDFDRWAKNFYVYRDTNGSGEWSQIPHDKDLTFGNRFYDDEISCDGFSFESGLPAARRRAHPFQGAAAHACCGAPNLMIDILVTDSRTREMYLRRLRTLMDEQLQSTGTPIGDRDLESRIDELATAITPDAALDLAKWGAIYGRVRDFPTAITLLKSNYLDERRAYLYQTHAVGGPAGTVGIPNAQPSGASLGIGSIEFNPASGDQAEEYVEITNPNGFAVDVSGWTVEGAIEHTFKPGTVIPSNLTGLPLYLSPDVNALRARSTSPTGNEQNFVQGNYSGQLSARGETITVRDTDGHIAATTTYVGEPSEAQQYLRISELHYHPADPTAAEIGVGFSNDGDFEFVELKNIGLDTIDIGGVRFESGIDFVIPGGTMLTAGEHAVVVSNQAAFEERYGAGIN
ncbi:MAG: CotH kinase family protein, partial [Verrucomicrobiales bacterium]|nr:CotH kinase family protein [Verrucomicrobiales bacterium]